MPEHKVYRVDIPVHLGLEIGHDPATLPDHRIKTMCSSQAALICESLFWAIEQLGNMVQQEPWIYCEETLSNALQHIGQLGQAMASATGEQAEYIEHVAARLDKKGKGGKRR
jgi:hypothetical protein